MNRAFSKRAILVVVCVFGALNAGGNASLKQRVNTLEVRVNGIEMRVNTDNTVIRTTFDSVQQDIESLNASVALLEDQVCPSEGSTENIGEAERFPTVSAENVKLMQLSKMVVTQGLVDEKKWLREKLEGFSNLIRSSVEGFKSDMRTFKTTLQTETDDKITRQRNEFTKMQLAFANIEINFTYVIRNVEGLKSDMSTFKTTLQTETDDKITRQRNEFTKMQKAVANIEKNLKELNEWRNAIEDQVTSRLEKVKTTLNSDNKMLQQQTQEMKSKLFCPDGWTEFQSFCYLYIAERKKYMSAHNYCASLDASVADIENGAENEFLVHLLEQNGHQWDDRSYNTPIWVGRTDLDTEGIWISDRTGSEITYANWRNDQPNGGTSQNCIGLGSKKPYNWADIRCNFYFEFVCKKETSSFNS